MQTKLSWWWRQCASGLHDFLADGLLLLIKMSPLHNITISPLKKYNNVTIAQFNNNCDCRDTGHFRFAKYQTFPYFWLNIVFSVLQQCVVLTNKRSDKQTWRATKCHIKLHIYTNLLHIWIGNFHFLVKYSTIYCHFLHIFK